MYFGRRSSDQRENFATLTLRKFSKRYRIELKVDIFQFLVYNKTVRKKISTGIIWRHII